VFAIFILAVAAAESSIGLAILIVYYRVRGSIVTQEINELKG
jgi:NADH-quinone oxidoreductase subunit K